jgi:hypothetical protein
MERDRSKSSSRALARKIARDWRRLLARTRSFGTSWNSADNPNAFTQSKLANAWGAGAISAAESVSSLATSASSHPSALWQTPQSGPEPGGAAQLAKAVVHLHNSGINCPLDLHLLPSFVWGNNRILRQSLTAATHRQQRAPERSSLHAPQELGEGRAPWAAALSAAIILLRQLADHNQSAPIRSSYHACVTVIGEAEKVTHSIHCRNPMSPQGASHAPST